MSAVRDFKPLAAPAISDADLDAFARQKGMPTLRSIPQPELSATVSSVKQTKPSQATRRVTLDLPEYVVDQLHDRARAGRCTTRHVIMSALITDGVAINQNDMISDGRRLR